MSVAFLRYLALVSYFGLIVTLLLWILIAPHSAHFPIAAMLLLGVFPLLLPMRGILYARPYTHAWTSFLMLAYFTHGIGEIYSEGQHSLYAWLEVILSTLCFFACIIYVKVEAKLRNTSQNQS